MASLNLALAIIFNVAAYLIFKAIAHRDHGLVWFSLFCLGLVLGAANIWCFTMALRSIGLAIAYPIFAGVCITSTILFSAIVFGEQLTPVKLIGAGLVLLGVILLAR